MTGRAPGLDALRNDGGCFNCGSQDHFAYACPEPTRKDPHGAGVFRQRQAEKSMQASAGKGTENPRSKGGLVVTRYGPPPSQYPPPANAWGPGGPYPPPAPAPIPPPNPYAQQPPLPYPPPSQIPPPYPPPYPPANGGYGSSVPPPPSPGPLYGQYGQAPYQPPPPPPSYGPPGSYAPGSYPPPYQPPNPSYPAAPPPIFQGPPPPLPPPPVYASGYGAILPPGPPPPPNTYPPPSHVPGYDAPAPYANPYPPPPGQSWQQEPNGYNNQRHKDRRDRRNDRDKGSKNKHHRRDNDNNQRGRGQRRETSSRQVLSHSRQQSPKPSTMNMDDKEDKEDKANKANKDDKDELPSTESPAVTKEENSPKDDELDQDFLWDLEKAFVQSEPKPADPVGKPLASEWSDDPTIPPAYNAKCIKSVFYDPDNPDAFLASVRDTKYWPDLKRDPVFRYRRGMVAVQFAGSHHEYFTYHCSRKIGSEWFKERDIVPTPSDATLNDAIKSRNSHQVPNIHGDSASPPKYPSGKRGYDEADDYRREAKRSKNFVGRDRSPPRQYRRPSPRDTDNDGYPWGLQTGKTRIDSPHRPHSRDGYSRSPSGYRLQPGDRLAPYGSTQRHDSGYHSAQSAEKYRSQRDDRSHSHHLSPPPSVRARERDNSLEREQDWERGRGRSPSYSRPLRSRTRSPSPAALDSDDESGMSDLEYELLGLERPKKKVVAPKSAIKKPRVRVNDAFSRRW